MFLRQKSEQKCRQSPWSDRLHQPTAAYLGQPVRATLRFRFNSSREYKGDFEVRTGNAALGLDAKITVRFCGQFSELALIEAHGEFTPATWRRLTAIANDLRADSSVYAVILVIDSEAGHWPCCEAHRASGGLLRLRRAKQLIGFVESAIGASYLAAACCGSIIAAPAAPIGLFAVGCDVGNAAFALAIQDARPLARDKALEHCECRTISGEAAASGWARLADALVPSVDHLLAALFKPKGEPRQ